MELVYLSIASYSQATPFQWSITDIDAELYWALQLIWLMT